MVDDNFYMDLCLKEAWRFQGLTYPNPAVGSLILDNLGKLIAIEAHRSAGDSHAELSVISKAFEIFGDENISSIKSPSQKHRYILENHNGKFRDFTIYVTLEPCNHTGSTPPCSILIKKLGFKKIIIGSMDPTDKASGGADILEKSGMIVKKGVLKDRCDELIKPFKKWQERKPYIFFKLALSKNGTYTGGLISSYESRELVHKLRQKIDLLIIGGNTVRVDRPTLDSRLSGGKAPDVLIYSHDDNFDRDIPLFGVKNREVFISNSFDIVKNYHFIMVEGGEGMIEATMDILEDYMIFTSPNFKMGESMQLDLRLKRVHSYENRSDTIEWFRKI